MKNLRLLFVSTPVGPLGSGLGGGVELTLLNLCHELQKRGHQITLVAPQGSELSDLQIIEIAGQLQPTAHTQARHAPVLMPENSVLARMWEYVYRAQKDYDLIVNFAYDWLPFYLTKTFYNLENKKSIYCPLAHFVSMGSLTNIIDNIISEVAYSYPGIIGVYTQAQARTFPFAEMCRIMGSAVDIDQYQFRGQPGAAVAWLGRISPEKGLEDAVKAVDSLGVPLKILGKLENLSYWEAILSDFPNAPIEYLGFLSTEKMQLILRDCRALLMTPRWVEAFGNVAIEALACGVPIIAYDRGGPAEIVRPGETGWLVAPDSVSGLVAAIKRINELDRFACRRQAEIEFSLEAWGNRFEKWFNEITDMY